jgi:excinuclease ABC subunit A
LHPRDNVALLDTLDALKKKGNALVIVEHDEDTLMRADHVIDLGPGAGKHGGRVVAQGTLESLKNAEESVTGKCLREPLQHPMRGERRLVELDKEIRWLTLSGASLHNVRALDLKIPIGRLSVFTGISGSGKSTMMRGLLKPALQGALASKLKGGAMKTRDGAMLRGAEYIEAVYEVDQSPIGKTSRSTPATYLGVFDHIRALFASTPLARIRGYEAGRFSFNSQGGRCEACLGQGVLKIEMNFLPPAHVRCPDCDGSRYALATLEVLCQGRSIADVMAMPMDEAVEFFGVHAAIARPLRLLCETGLGYLTLGQASQTLSGGEAQRLKLVSELVRGIGRTEHKRIRKGVESRSVLYLLEEPTIGLHMADVRHLLAVLHRLVDAGHTVVVIEHHTSVIAEADHLIEVGPEAGAAGGLVIAEGTPEEVVRERVSRIAPFLKPLLAGNVKTSTSKKKKARSI